MIRVEWAGSLITWRGPHDWSVTGGSAAGRAAVRAALGRRITRRRSEELEDGTIGEAVDELRPGTAEHATAALLALPGARLASTLASEDQPAGR